jgi:hypothetical protein
MLQPHVPMRFTCYWFMWVAKCIQQFAWSHACRLPYSLLPSLEGAQTAVAAVACSNPGCNGRLALFRSSPMGVRAGEGGRVVAVLGHPLCTSVTPTFQLGHEVTASHQSACHAV